MAKAPKIPPKILAAMRALDLKDRERIMAAAVKQLDSTVDGVKALFAAKNVQLEKQMRHFFEQLTLDQISGFIDPLAPQNSVLLAALRNDLDAFSVEMTQAVSAATGSGLAAFTGTAAQIWADSAAGEMIMMEGVADGIRKIKGISDAMASNVFAEVRSALMVGGVTRKELDGKLADLLGKTTNQASRTVHEITFNGYRQANLADGQRAGAERYHMTGPVDDRITQICFNYIGQIMTRDEWLAISADVFRQGLHYNCRHQWVAVSNRRYEKLQSDITGERLIWNEAARVFINDVESCYDGSVKQWFADNGGSGTSGGKKA